MNNVAVLPLRFHPLLGNPIDVFYTFIPIEVVLTAPTVADDATASDLMHPMVRVDFLRSIFQSQIIRCENIFPKL